MRKNKTNGMINTFQYEFKNIPLNIAEDAMSNFEVLKFNTLKSYFPNLKSKKEFLQSESYLGNISLQIESPYKKLQAKDIYDGTIKILKEISLYLQKLETEYEGTKEFYAKRIYEVLKDKKYIYLIHMVKE